MSPNEPSRETEDSGKPEGLSGKPEGLSGKPEGLSGKEVAHVANLARLALTDDELERFAGQLRAVLQHVEAIQALDLSSLPPSVHPTGMSNVFREDAIGPGLDREEVLAAAPSVEDNRFKVTRILGDAP